MTASIDDYPPPTWASRELPILRVALRRLDGGEDFVGLTVLSEDTGLDVDATRIGLRALADAYYLEVRWVAPVEMSLFTAATKRARRELGTWPTADSLVDQLVAALRADAEAEHEPERRSRVRTAADVLAGMARDIAVSVIATRLG